MFRAFGRYGGRDPKISDLRTSDQEGVQEGKGMGILGVNFYP